MKKVTLWFGMKIAIYLTISLLWAVSAFAEPPAGYTLTWSDEFDGDNLDVTKWEYRTDSKHWSTQNPTNVAVSGGMLSLSVKKEALRDMQYTGSGVISKRLFKYGYYEAKFRVPAGAGWHTSFWLMKYDSSGGTGTKGARQEIDICEQDSVELNVYSLNLHDWEGKHKSYGRKRVKTEDLSASFHVWGCEFTPKLVRYYFDGELVQELDATQLNHGDHNIWLTSIASHLGRTKAVDESKLPAAAVYDYVRFYEKRTVEQSPEADDVQIIVERHTALAMSGSEDADAQIPGILKLLDEYGHFTDLKYTYGTYGKGGTLGPHLSRTQILAQAWGSKGGKYSGDRKIRDKAFLALRGWLEEDPKDKNWWWRRIGWPARAWQAPMILRGELKKESPELLASWVTYLMHSQNGYKMEGANATDIQMIILAAGALAGKYDVMKVAVHRSRNEFRIVTGSTEGLYSDGSFAQHNKYGRQLYFGGYGEVYIGGFLRIAPLVRDTSLALTEENTKTVEDYFLKGISSVTYGPEYLDILVHGRSFGRSRKVPAGIGCAPKLKQFIDLDPPRKEDLKTLYNRLNGVEGARQPTANRMFWHADYMTHMRHNYYVSVRGTSKRTVGNESGNGEGKMNYHMGDGVNMILHRGDEYREILPIWDWQRLPGTTVEQKKGELGLVDWGCNAAGGTDFAGGVSDGRYGAYAFVFDEGGANVNVDAYKATFFFDAEFVALGAGIVAPNAKYPVVTTVNQTLHKGPFWVGSKIGKTRHAEGVVSLTAGDWINHYGTGYILLDVGGKATARVAEQTGNWKMLYSNMSPDPVTGSVFSLSIDHGKSIEKPTKYAYVVVPGKEPEVMAQYAAELPIEILANTSGVQAVRHNGLGITSIIFYEPECVCLGQGETLTSDRSACVMIREKGNEIHLSVATPLYRKDTVKLTFSGLLDGEGVIRKKDTKSSEVTVELKAGHDAGRTATTILKRLP